MYIERYVYEEGGRVMGSERVGVASDLLRLSSDPDGGRNVYGFRKCDCPQIRGDTLSDSLQSGTLSKKKNKNKK